MHVRLPDPEALRSQYAMARPFPHVVIDDFIDRTLITQLADEFPPINQMEIQFADAAQVKAASATPDRWGTRTRELMEELNGDAVLRWLTSLTGIRGLRADDSYEGGGQHQIARGGKLGIHADFDSHQRTGERRRLNLLLYLNEHWQESWGGQLELWTRDMSRLERRILPVAGRAVLFATESDSFHGHPDPLQCPVGVTRKSLAAYYYTAPEAQYFTHRTTHFQIRPGSSDRAPRMPLKGRAISVVRRAFPKRIR